MSTNNNLPKILILGGCGFIGRNLIKYLIDNNCALWIKIVDKTIPAMSYLHPMYESIYESSIVEHQQADLTKPEHVEKAFTTSKHIENISFDIVFNLAAETRHGQPESLYISRCVELSELCAAKALACGVKRFVELSTALVYPANTSRPCSEDSNVSPWTTQARYKLEAEQEVLSLCAQGLDAVILRPAFVYGPGDYHMLMTRAACAAAYVHLGEKMSFLWDAGLRINTVHVLDVCRAMVHVTDRSRVPAGSIWNLCDKGDTNQGKVNAMLRDMFGITCGFHGFVISNLARIRLKEVVSHANEKHLAPWVEICKRHNIPNSPISPFMSLDLLRDNGLHVNGEAIEATGFQYTYPELTVEEYRRSIELAIEAEIFPRILV